ncbi:hypothetical protein CC80DRAFT_597773 [Byssothecium circinans]|uniref:Uncharacterized protein n=1 Tax=Byssothecium circinans TaxID=147558 RepID=A0A6A5TFG5_9PLEO|nr:hypothetical protein CC80DRAFT_597773 [Byssothecium circinans]
MKATVGRRPNFTERTIVSLLILLIVVRLSVCLLPTYLIDENGLNGPHKRQLLNSLIAIAIIIALFIYCRPPKKTVKFQLHKRVQPSRKGTPRVGSKDPAGRDAPGAPQGHLRLPLQNEHRSSHDNEASLGDLPGLESQLRRKIHEAQRTTQAAIRRLKILQGTQQQPRQPQQGAPSRGNPSNPETLEHLCYEAWQMLDLQSDFRLIDRLVYSLAHSLTKHVAGNQLARSHLVGLSNHLPLIKGTPEELWSRHGLLMFRGAVWSILLGTIFSNEFAVFGKRARNLASEWVEPDVRHHPAHQWRSLTAYELLIKAGILQYTAILNKIPTECLTGLLYRKFNISDSISKVAQMLATSTSGGVDASQRAGDIFKNTDQLARQSIHEARAGFVAELEVLTGLLGATKSCHEDVERVVTQAQILAFQWAVQLRAHRFVEPNNGEMYQRALDRDQHDWLARTLCCRHVHDSPIVFTIHPGFRRFEADDSLVMLDPAEVYLDYEPDAVFETHVPSQQPVPCAPIGTNAHGFPSPLADDLKVLSDLIETFVSKLEYLPGKDIPEHLRKHILVGRTSSFPTWNNIMRNRHFTQSAIWRILFENLFEHPFAVYGNDTGTPLRKEWEKLRRDDRQQSTSYSLTWRLQRCRKVVSNSLGGETLFTQPQNCEPWDPVLHDGMMAVKADIYKAIVELLQLVCSKLPLQQDVCQIIERAMLIAIRISVDNYHAKFVIPVLHTPWAQPTFGEAPLLELIEVSYNITRGRIAFIGRPGVEFYLDANEEYIERDIRGMLPLAYIEDSVSGPETQSVKFPSSVPKKNVELPLPPTTKMTLALEEANARKAPGGQKASFFSGLEGPEEFYRCSELSEA